MACAHWINKIVALCISCCLFTCVRAQQTPPLKNNYLLVIRFTDKDSLFKPQDLKLQTEFNNEPAVIEYINALPMLLASKGYPVASVDSFWNIE